jgi:hypothetical protein
LAQDVLRLLLIGPEVRVVGQRFEALNLFLLAGDVKDASGTSRSSRSARRAAPSILP